MQKQNKLASFEEAVLPHLDAALHELEEMSYREIASITDLPLGTVMSRLARGRKPLQLALTNQMHAEVFR